MVSAGPSWQRVFRAPIVASAGLIVCASVGLFACGSCGSSQPTGPDDGSGGGGIEVAPDPEQVAFGARVFRAQGCVTCHTIDGRESTAPTFLGLYGQPRVLGNGRRVVADEAYLRRSIREPSAELVAGYTNQMIRYTPELLSETELDALVAFIVSLRDREGVAPLPEGDPMDPAAGAGAGAEGGARAGDAPGGGEGAGDDGNVESGPDGDATNGGAGGGDGAEGEAGGGAEMPLRLRSDGRPEWWLDNPVTDDDGRVVLADEALGVSLRDASERAIERARARLRERLGVTGDDAIRGERIENTLVLPLPNPGGSFRFVGYVKISGMPAAR
ncbi:MAG: c-type cytochrome [Phycisphaerales bacterium]